MLDQLETMDIDELRAFFNVSRTTIFRMVGDGVLPSPIRLGKKSRWLKASIEKVVQNMTEDSEKNLACNRQRYRRVA